MAIQIPNLGAGDGLTGDNELVIRQKYNANFSDTTHAASRLVGNGANQLPQAQDIPSLLGTAATKNTGTTAGRIPLVDNAFSATYGQYAVTPSASVSDFNNIPQGQRSSYVSGSIPNAPENVGYWSVECHFVSGGGVGELFQVAYQVALKPIMYIRTRNTSGIWTAWVNVSANSVIQSTFSSSAAVASAKLGATYQAAAGALGLSSASDTDYIFTTYAGREDLAREFQIAYGITTASSYIRLKPAGGSYGAWRPIAANVGIYSNTTASGANVVVDITGNLLRSTSSERYKEILAPLVLDDVKYANAMSLKPIVYRSTADADNPLHHYYSFSAEALGAFDPAFTLWRYTEQVTDANGVTTEQPLVERQAEGLNINALLAMSHAIAIKQDGLIKALEARIAALEAKGA